jgi:hypothetical protein
MKKYILLLLLCIVILSCKENITQINQQSNLNFNEFVNTNLNGLWEVTSENGISFWQFKLSPQNYFDSITWNDSHRYSDTLLLNYSWSDYSKRYEWNSYNLLWSIKYYSQDSIYAEIDAALGFSYIELNILTPKKWYATFWRQTSEGWGLFPIELIGTLIE